MAVPRQEKAYEKHAWILVLASGIVTLVLASVFILITPNPDPGAILILTGMKWEDLLAVNPKVADAFRFYIKFEGVFWLAYSVLVIAVVLKSYRRGEKWAWYVLWVVPALFGMSIALDLSVGGPFVPPMTLLLIISLLGLLLPYRKFFPKKEPVPP